eukprot:168347-Chlamydomonas_euryale.AAC.2
MQMPLHESTLADTVAWGKAHSQAQWRGCPSLCTYSTQRNSHVGLVGGGLRSHCAQGGAQWRSVCDSAQPTA